MGHYNYSRRNFHLSNSPAYGNCYTFNTRLNPEDDLGGKRVTSLTGPNYGLSVVVNVEQEKYLGNGRTKQVTFHTSIHLLRINVSVRVYVGRSEDGGGVAGR